MAVLRNSALEEWAYGCDVGACDGLLREVQVLPDDADKWGSSKGGEESHKEA